MKKLMALVAALMMVMTLMCGAVLAEEKAPGEIPMIGGWTVAAEPEVTEAVQAMVEKGTEGLLGVNYVPVAYLGSQLVAGTNHAVLCQATVIYPNAQPKYVILYLYEDLQGNVQVLNVADFDIGAFCTYGAE